MVPQFEGQTKSKLGNVMHEEGFKKALTNVVAVMDDQAGPEQAEGPWGDATAARSMAPLIVSIIRSPATRSSVSSHTLTPTFAR